MVENIPFMHAIGETVADNISAHDDYDLFATTLMVYSVATVLTAVVFFIMGRFHAGALLHFFPRHILVGCIGGVGMFVLTSALQVCMHIPIHYSTVDFISVSFMVLKLPLCPCDCTF